MYLVAIAWIYVVLMMALAEASSPQGSVLGAVVTFVLYGVLPLSIVLYLMGSPARRRALKAAEALQAPLSPAPSPATQPPQESFQAPDGSSHAAGDTVAPKREKP
jgi:ABC-type transport system involved in cytochrome c biogenesis permease subunit